jgi:hypothetical protein
MKRGKVDGGTGKGGERRKIQTIIAEQEKRGAESVETSTG